MGCDNLAPKSPDLEKKSKKFRWLGQTGAIADLSGMRKQYHFWPNGDGQDAWDVDRLIELTEQVPAESVLVDSIGEVDTPCWFARGDHPTVCDVVRHARLMAEVDRQYPIILGPDGRVMDGMHRIARAILEGDSTIKAVRLPTLPEPDYVNVQPGDLTYER